MKHKGKSNKKNSRARKDDLHCDSKFFAQRTLRNQQKPIKRADSKTNAMAIDSVICPETLDEQYRQQQLTHNTKTNKSTITQKSNATSIQADKADPNKPANKNQTVNINITIFQNVENSKD